jgi:hypothetical protein
MVDQMKTMKFLRAAVVGISLLGTTALTTPAMAQWHGGAHYGGGWGGGWHGDGHYGWGGGWRPGWGYGGYGWRGGWGWGWGWGWGVGAGIGLGLSAAWLAYPYSWYPWAYDPWAYPPAYAYNAPPQAGAVPNQAPNWYYCESAKSYYPYVSSCAEGWRQVPASPPPR